MLSKIRAVAWKRASTSRSVLLQAAAASLLLSGRASAQHVHTAPAGSSDWFTNYGNYIPRVHCLQKADGSPDWFWIVALIASTATVILAYLRIYAFWLKCYLAEQPENRNPKLLQLANIFFLCASTGYGLSILMFFWPAYRLVLFFTLALSIWAIAFNLNLKDFEITFFAVRLLRERDAAQLELAARARSMKLILDSVGDGLMNLDLTGRITGDRSRMILSWFGADLPDDGSVARYLFGADAQARGAFEFSFEQLVSEVFPFEVAADQMPKQLTRNGSTYELDYRPVESEGKLEGVVIVVRDITRRLEADRADREAREVQQLVGQLLTDTQGFRRFVEDGAGLVARICADTSDRAATLRDLHTLKGNCYVYGARSVGDVVHEVESRLVAGEQLGSFRDSVGSAWDAMFARIRVFVDGRLEAMQVSSKQYDELRTRLRERDEHEHILPILRRLAAQTERLAGTLGKRVDVQIDDGALALPPNSLDPLWSVVVHLLRNAVYHGIEPESERLERGKAEHGTISLATAARADGRLTVDVKDDGRGIDFEGLRRVAGAPASATREEILDLVFRGGVSTATEANEIAGRGVGVSAVASTCEALGGRMRIDTEEGRGTCFHFSFPPPALA